MPLPNEHYQYYQAGTERGSSNSNGYKRGEKIKGTLSEGLPHLSRLKGGKKQNEGMGAGSFPPRAKNAGWSSTLHLKKSRGKKSPKNAMERRDPNHSAKGKEVKKKNLPTVETTCDLGQG